MPISGIFPFIVIAVCFLSSCNMAPWSVSEDDLEKVVIFNSENPTAPVRIAASANLLDPLFHEGATMVFENGRSLEDNNSTSAAGSSAWNFPKKTLVIRCGDVAYSSLNYSTPLIVNTLETGSTMKSSVVEAISNWMPFNRMTVISNRLFCESGSSGKLFVFDITDLRHPVWLTNLSYFYGIAFYEQRIYICELNRNRYEFYGLSALTLNRDPLPFTNFSEYGANTLPQLTAAAGHLYLQNGGNCSVFDLSGTSVPVRVQILANFDFYLNTGSEIAGDYVYNVKGGEHGVEILSLSDPHRPVVIGSIPVARASKVKAGNNRLYVSAFAKSSSISIIW